MQKEIKAIEDFSRYFKDCVEEDYSLSNEDMKRVSVTLGKIANNLNKTCKKEEMPKYSPDRETWTLSIPEKEEIEMPKYTNNNPRMRYIPKILKILLVALVILAILYFLSKAPGSFNAPGIPRINLE